MKQSRTHTSLQTSQKIFSPKLVVTWVEKLQKKKKKIVFTNGCFDLLHLGHITYLSEARKMGDILLVALNTDASIRRLKGEQRPLVPLKDRAEMLAALECVDVVTWFSSNTPQALIEKIKPQYLVKGGDWSEDEIVGARFVKMHGGKVKSLSFRNGRSTTDLIKKVQELR